MCITTFRTEEEVLGMDFFLLKILSSAVVPIKIVTVIITRILKLHFIPTGTA